MGKFPDYTSILDLLADLVDPNKCHFDHHGYCQEHAWMTKHPACPHQRAKDLLYKAGYPVK
jgi:hypothetical protein